jgi:hypothetical protein
VLEDSADRQGLKHRENLEGSQIIFFDKAKL